MAKSPCCICNVYLCVVVFLHNSSRARLSTRHRHGHCVLDVDGWKYRSLLDVKNTHWQISCNMVNGRGHTVFYHCSCCSCCIIPQPTAPHNPQHHNEHQLTNTATLQRHQPACLLATGSVYFVFQTESRGVLPYVRIHDGRANVKVWEPVLYC